MSCGYFPDLLSARHFLIQRKKVTKGLHSLHGLLTFAPLKSPVIAQVAESVDALVSNTSVFIDMPVRSRPWVPERENLRNQDFPAFFYPFPEEVLKIDRLYVWGFDLGHP
jgi:hypothetical protein